MVAAGTTVTAAEVGVLAGITATATEINRACDTSGKVVTVTSATLTVTEALHDGKLIVLSKADGITVTLPNATGSGAVYTFLVGVSVTSVGDIIKVARGADVMYGVILGADDTATPAARVWKTAADATSDTVTMDGSTRGGVIGDRLIIVDIAANKYTVHGTLNQSGTEATPFSATVS